MLDLVVVVGNMAMYCYIFVVIKILVGMWGRNFRSFESCQVDEIFSVFDHIAN